MVSAYIYRLVNTARKKPIVMGLVVLGLIFAVMSVIRLDTPKYQFFEVPNYGVINGISKLLVLISADYAYAVGFRSGVLGVSLPDVNFHLAGPYSKRFNLVMSFGYGLGSLFFFIWFLTVNMSFLSMWIGFGTSDYLHFLVQAIIAMIIMFLFTSYISAAYPESIKARVWAMGVLLAYHFAAFFLILHDLIVECGSFQQVKEQSILVLLDRIGNSRWIAALPITGWNSLVYTNLNGFTFLLIIIEVLFVVVLGILYFKTEFDFYETAGANAQKIADIVESSRAGVEAVNTGISRTAKVGNEVYEKGWGANAFFWQHLFQNRRESKFFFVNKVALIYRIFALIILLVSGNVLEEKLIVVIMGVTTMMVLNSIVYGGGKIVFEFNRPYFYMVPETPGKKFAACLMADLPEMLFDAVLCAIIVKIPSGSSFGILSIIAFVLMMVMFDLVSQTLGIICVRLFRSLGKSVLMMVRYVTIIVFILVGMTLSFFITEFFGRLATSDDMIIAILVGSMALAFVGIWAAMVPLAVRIISRRDVNW